MKRITILILAAVAVVFLLSACKKDVYVTSSFDAEEITPTLEEIFESDKDDLVIEMCSYLLEKCDYGERVELLTDTERRFYLLQLLSMEVNNGGFWQFFYNSSGNYCYELPEILEEIEADAISDIYEKALSAFGCPLPLDIAERREVIDSAKESVFELLSECDTAFYRCEELFNECCYSYIINNKDGFQ